MKNISKESLGRIKKTVILILVLCLFSLIGFKIGGIVSKKQFSDDTIARRWVDGKYGQAFYGVHVFAKKSEDQGLDVFARISIGEENDYFHDCGKIGAATDIRDAREKFGKIEANNQEIAIGEYKLARSKLESHR